MVSHAAICDQDGNIWATSSGFAVTPAELKYLSTNFANMEVMPLQGITVDGTKYVYYKELPSKTKEYLFRYMFLSATDRVIRGKKGTSGVHIMKTVQAIIVCVYQEPIVAEQVSNKA